MRSGPPAWVIFVAVATTLGIVAVVSPLPDRVTDRDVYEATARQGVVPDCGDLHCFRVLVPWVLGSLPGGSLAKWKAYAVACNTVAAIAVFQLCLIVGSSRRAAWLASAASAFGFGSLYTLHDPYTSDPLMFMAGPLITNQLMAGRLAFAAAIGAVGVFAKEFAAAPLFAFAACRGVERRWLDAARALVAANAAFIVWLLLTLTLMLKFNYSYGGSDSANLGGGAGIGPWLHRMSPRGALSAMFNEFGALYVLMPIGFFLVPPPVRRLALVSLPIAAVFAYVQQPDRALWNFHFLVAPMAAAVLHRAHPALAWATIAAFAAGNLRVGAQLPIAPLGRVALVLSVALAIASTVTALRTPRPDLSMGHSLRGATSA